MMTKRAVVVLGMHHSGTSVVARSLAVFGVYLGDDLMASQPDHPRGFWEDNRITATNDRILTALGFSWRKPGFDCNRMKKYPGYRQTVRQVAEDVRTRFGHVPLWGFKDPRTCRLVPFWKSVFQRIGADASYIISVRHPRSVAESLHAKYGLSLRKGYTLWLEHMAAAVSATQYDNRVFVSYDRMLDDPGRELRREAVALNLDLSKINATPGRIFIESFLDQNLRHTRYDRESTSLKMPAQSVYGAAFTLLDAVAADAIPQEVFSTAWKTLLRMAQR
ncbi:MAG: sulfotransferase family protein [Phycisphaerae bacterium]